MPEHMASESRDMLIGTKVAGPAKSHLYWSPSLLQSFRRLRSMFAPLGSERIFLDLGVVKAVRPRRSESLAGSACPGALAGHSLLREKAASPTGTGTRKSVSQPHP